MSRAGRAGAETALTWCGHPEFAQTAFVGWLQLHVYPAYPAGSDCQFWYWVSRAGDEHVIANARHSYKTAGAAKFAAHVETEFLLSQTCDALIPSATAPARAEPRTGAEERLQRAMAYVPGP